MIKKCSGLVALLLCTTITACSSSSIGGAAGAITGVASSAATANPLVGYSVGVTVQAITDASVKYVFRTWTQQQQDAMAFVAGALEVGQSATWQVDRWFYYGNEYGRLEVVRDIPNPLVACKEIAFSVEQEGYVAKQYVAAICKNNEQWKWATVEPSVFRWVGLQ